MLFDDAQSVPIPPQKYYGPPDLEPPAEPEASVEEEEMAGLPAAPVPPLSTGTFREGSHASAKGIFDVLVTASQVLILCALIGSQLPRLRAVWALAQGAQAKAKSA